MACRRKKFRSGLALGHIFGLTMPCTLIQQDHQRKKRVYQKVLRNSDTSFSNPVDMSSSDAESFDEDDMYGSDHGMETVSESSDEESEAKILQSPEGRPVSVWTLPAKSDDLTSE